MLHISLSGETVAYLGNFKITNTILTTWLVMIFITIFSLVTRRKIALVPSGLQSVVEIVVSSLYSTFESVLGTNIKKLFPFLASIFLFIWLNNIVGILPGVGPIGIVEESEKTSLLVPLFRPAAADLNTTLSLAFLAFVVVQFYGIKALGVVSHLGKYFSFKDPISFFVGLLEIVSEGSRIVSFAFRLFGNIFAGEVLLTVIAFLMPLIAPIPFLGLELFVGFIQALVFSMLTAVFISVAIIKH